MNVTSFFIGNIDIDAKKQDIYDHLKYYELTPTFIKVYYGRNGAAAKVNVHVFDAAYSALRINGCKSKCNA